MGGDGGDGPVVLVGAGHMGGAMLRGWLDAGLPPDAVLVLDPSPGEAVAEAIAAGSLRHETDVPNNVKAGVIVIAVKPQMIDAVLPPLAPLVDRHTAALSVAAGTPMGRIADRLGLAAVVRAMPNTPAMVGRGITAAIASGAVTPAQRRRADWLLSAVGQVEWLDDEALIDAVTAVSGSGPAYVFYLVECMAAAGREAGLPEDLAMRLARATVSGAGEMLHRSIEDAARLRANVTSPGGTTAAALAVLMRDDAMKALFVAAVAAAERRARELAG